MALRVWLPLNGNLNNLGASNGTVATTVTNAWDDNGKIGKCALSNIKASYTFPELTDITNFSISYWIYIDSSVAVQNWADIWGINCVVGNSSTIIRDEFQSAVGVHQLLMGKDSTVGSNTNTYIGTGMSTSNAKDKWVHVALVKDNTTAKVYTNGVLTNTINSSTFESTPQKLTGYLIIGNTTSSAAKLNDFRLYDHCLSALEVKEIAQGLILHYKLDGFNGGVKENLLLLSDKDKNGSHTSYVIADYNFTESLVSGEVYTVSAKVNTSSEKTFVGFYHSGGSYSMSGWLPVSSNGIYVKTFTATSNMASQTSGSGHGYCRVYVSNNPAGTQGSYTLAGTANVEWIKVEKGSGATRWTKALSESSESLYVSDSSGYKNNGTITGNVSFTNNSDLKGRYNTTAYIPVGSTDYITTINTIGNPEDAITMSIWFKSANTAPGNNYHEIFNHATSSQYFEFAIQNTGLFRGGMVIDGTRYVANTAQLGLLDGNWHMLSMTYDGTTLVRYVDGISRSTTSIAGKLTGKDAKFMIGHYGPNTNYHAKEAYVADARIYATALSAADIMTLYNTSANVDKLGGGHAFEMVENINNKELMTYGLFTGGYGDHNHLTRPFTNYNDKGEMTFNKTVTNAGSEYFKVNPSGKTYYYDIIVSVSTGNQFYIGFQRYDAAKTARSNNATVYVVATKPTSDAVYQRYKGTVDLSTDGVNPCDTISLRVLNNWTNSTSDTTGLATIHYLSLREVTGTPQTGSVKKNGQFITDEFIERDGIGSLYKNGIGGFTNIIEK